MQFTIKNLQKMIQFTEQFITPELAKQMLIGNEGNRKLRLRTVSKYAEDIINGRWRTSTGETIKVSETGKLIDGQHRLHAVIKSNKSVNMHVVTGLKDDTFDVIDTGLNRGSADVFNIDGIPNYVTIPSIIQAYFTIKNKQIKTNSSGLTNSQLLSVYHDDAENWQFCAKKAQLMYLSFSKILHKSVIGSLLKLFKEASDEETAIYFFNQLCVGKEYTNDTIIWLRKRLTDDRLSNTKLPISTKYELIIKSWNMFRKGKTAKNLRVTGEIETII